VDKELKQLVIRDVSLVHNHSGFITALPEGVLHNDNPLTALGLEAKPLQEDIVMGSGKKRKLRDKTQTKAKKRRKTEVPSEYETGTVDMQTHPSTEDLSMATQKQEVDAGGERSQPLISIGDGFYDFESLTAKVVSIQNLTGVVFSIHDSQLVTTANRTNTGKKHKALLDEKFKYRYVKWNCKHFGSVRTTSRGLRPNQK
jgi:hypothetical protein